MRIALILLPLAGLLAACPSTQSTAQPCHTEPLPTALEARLAAPRPQCDEGRGSGAFGRWTVDERGYPAYDYTLNEAGSPLALYTNSLEDQRRTHWSGFGNDRTTALAYNHGAIEVLTTQRGVASLQKIDPANGRWGGGIGVVVDGDDTFSTLAWNLKDIERRRFEVDGLQVVAGKRDLTLEHRVWAPAGDAAAFQIEATLVNDAPYAKVITYLETWDINPEQRFFGLVSSGLTKERAEYNGNFAVEGAWAQDVGRAEIGFRFKGTPPELPAERIGELPGAFLADMSGDAKRGYLTHEAVRFDRFGNVEARLAGGDTLALDSAEDAPTALTLRWDMEIPAFGRRTVRAAFGYRYPGDRSAEAIVAALRTPDLAAAWAANAVHTAPVYAAVDGEPWLTRETTWHSALLNVNSMYDDFFETHVYNQGSTYGFLQAVNGAPRDIVLALVPTIYFKPALAKENLRYIMRTTEKTGRIYYAAVGSGLLTGVGIHENPSDLDLFFLWGLSEYLLTTRDFAFLDEQAPYYGEPATAQTVLDHARVAYARLVNDIGTGAHGMLRLRDGDWSDGIILRAADQAAAKERGESSFDAALAAYALPRAAAALRAADATLASNLETLGAKQRDAFLATWQGEWYLRGYGDVDEPIGDSQLFLEPHAFALLADIVPVAERKKLMGAIAKKLEDPSPIGQLVVYPPDEGNTLLEPGWDVNGGTWYAINGVLTAAYAGFDGARAWQSLVKNSLMNHAEAYPNQWAGVWSAPDSFNAHYAERPGETFSHFATPMIDFPVLNSNAHALPLYATMRYFGLAVTTAGLHIAPADFSRPFALRTPWIAIAGDAARLAVEVTALAPGERWISLDVPPNAAGKLTVVEGELDASVKEDDRISVRWAPPKAGETLRVIIE